MKRASRNTLAGVLLLAAVGTPAVAAFSSGRDTPDASSGSASAGPTAVTDSPAANGRTADTSRIPSGFAERQANTGDITLNYVIGGHGAPLVLLHGYPQNWYMWRQMLPELARHYTVIAPDLRGSGGSDAPETGYDKKTLAADVHALLSELGHDQNVRLVGHDIGTMVAYAYAAEHPASVRQLVLSEAPLPDAGLYQFPSVTPAGPGFWNFGFFALDNGLPEQTIDGREEPWVDKFTDWLEVDKEAIGPRQIREYARPLRDDARLTASFEYFRAFPRDVADNEIYRQDKLTMPVLALGARSSLGESVPTQVRQYAEDVTGGVIEDSGHWIFEEQPDVLTERLLAFLTRD